MSIAFVSARDPVVKLLLPSKTTGSDAQPPTVWWGSGDKKLGYF